MHFGESWAMTNRICKAAATLVFLWCLVTLTSAFNWSNRSADLSSRLASGSSATKPAEQQRATLTLAERVAYQRAIEEVYWRHRIWPEERPDPKPPLDSVMSQAQLEKKVAEYLRDSEVLEGYWHGPITAEQLQAEMDRMAQHTKEPDVLREIFKALGNNAFVIAECLARPVLAEDLLEKSTTIIKNRWTPNEEARKTRKGSQSQRSLVAIPFPSYRLAQMDALRIRGQPPAPPTRPVPGRPYGSVDGQ